MAIVFGCEGCGARFEVAERLAGRVARCKHCGQPMTIPAATAARPMARVDVPSATVARASRTATSVATARPKSWVDAVNSNVGLKPISETKLRPVAKPSPLDDDDRPGADPYYDVVAAPKPRTPSTVSKAASGATIAYREQLLHVQRFFRWLNETANLIAIPFIGVFLIGLCFRSKSTCLLSATVIVLLNLTRLVTGFANLVVIPFRDSPLQGVLFLIPPLTFVYLAQNWKRVRKPVSRIAGPVLTIFGLVLAFAFEPWLSDAPKDAGLVERLESGGQSLKSGVQQKLDKAGVPVGNLDDLEQKARQAAESLENQARERLGNPQP